ncbi:hypothetical protein, partial [Robbsia andropogonis]|uniref:hypothetical protein n=1 Tax=Robbsia andropogonis TaxID=28092 RepID=UPI0012FAE742
SGSAIQLLIFIGNPMHINVLTPPSSYCDKTNHDRLMGPLGYIPPAEAEANYHRHGKINVTEAALT